MVDNVSHVTTICQGGLDTTKNHLLIEQMNPGGASELTNYEVGLFGGYRSLSGFAPFNPDFPEVDSAAAEGAVLGVAIYRSTNNTDFVIAARKQQSGATYKLYYSDPTGWVAYVPGFTLDYTNANGTVIKVRHAVFSFGGVNYILFVDGVNPPTLFNGTTWYQLSSSGTGTSANPGGNQLLDAPKYITIFKNHIFLAGDPSFNSVICHSAPTDPFDWTVASGGGQVTTASPVAQMKPFRETLYVFSETDLRRITVENATFVINDVATDIGCVAPDSVIEMNGDLVFFAQDGVRTVAGTDKIGDVNLASLSPQIQQYIKELQTNYDLSLLDSVVIKNKSQFRYFVSSASATAVGIGLIGGIRRNLDGNLAWEFSKLDGIRTSVATVGYYNSLETVLHGDYDGVVHQQESGNTFNGEVIASSYSTPFLTFGDPLTRKLPRKIHIFLKPEGDMAMSITTTVDWENPDATPVNTFSGSVMTSGFTYDSGTTYDSGAVYAAGVTYPIIDLDVEGSFKSLRINFARSEDAAPHTIQGYIIDFTPQGKR